jgi:SAM-dependent methyltransferase
MAGDTSQSATDWTVCGVDLWPLARISSETLREHGVTAAGAGWREAASQELRFSVLAQAVQIRPGDAVTVNDLGCGYGALYDYLVGVGVDVQHYRGYDISDEMLAAARARVPAEHGCFSQAPLITDVADFSLLSGPLNLKVADDEAWQLYSRAVVLNLAQHSRRGFAFNMMTTKVTYRVEELHYADPVEWLEWCRREISPSLDLFEDYSLYEWTIGGLTGDRG